MNEAYACPCCGADTDYQLFSGGREWYCPACDADGSYPDDAPTIRAHLLRTAEGRVALRAQADQEIARLKDGAGRERP